ncbi:HNH endonuclease [Pseudaminobacter salicylatoxidans]|uniref:HNH endonuclease n=1 Tax=Pseudaminobacter salicylatoxidans TaxID=93369 RepID=A0A316BZQ2_PSESE|nr:HNH endonuclease signature motif containing protein [Pseudaminobacter salicylatoxidans]PWJ80580.1 HNH endonuclease [Pseudaminobacter salicylatoxidans]
MARTRKEWIGDNDDQRAPPRVRQRVFDREDGKCHICRQPIIGKKWALDHVTALINGGENREKNLKPVHVACHAEKTAADVAEKAKVAKVRGKHTGAIRPKGRIPSPPKALPKQTAIDKSAFKALEPRAMFKEIAQ